MFLDREEVRIGIGEVRFLVGRFDVKQKKDLNHESIQYISAQRNSG